MELTKKTTPIIYRPDYASTMRELPLNETIEFEMVGNVKIAIVVAISRLRKAGHGFDVEYDYDRNVIKVTHTSIPQQL